MSGRIPRGSRPGEKQRASKNTARHGCASAARPAERAPPAVALAEVDRASHLARVREITRAPQTMKWVADGKCWTSPRLLKFFEYCEAERAQSAAVRQNYYHAVEVGGDCAGIVGIHPVRYDPRLGDRPAATIFLDPAYAGRGVGTAALLLALAAYWAIHPGRAIVFDVRESNQPMRRVLAKLGAKGGRPVTIQGLPYRRYFAAPADVRR